MPQAKADLPRAPLSVCEGDAVLIRARIRRVYPEQGMVLVRFLTSDTKGWTSGVLPLATVAKVVTDPRREREPPIIVTAN